MVRNASTINSNTETNILDRHGVLIRLTVTNPGTNWVISIYDNTEAAGTPIAVYVSAAGGGTFEFNRVTKTGITIKGTGTAGNANLVYG